MNTDQEDTMISAAPHERGPWRVEIPGGGFVTTSDQEHAYAVRDEIPGAQVVLVVTTRARP